MLEFIKKTSNRSLKMWNYSDKVMNLFYHPHNIGAIAPYECLEGEAIAISDMKRLMHGRDVSHLGQ